MENIRKILLASVASATLFVSFSDSTLASKKVSPGIVEEVDRTPPHTPVQDRRRSIILDRSEIFTPSKSSKSSAFTILKVQDFLKGGINFKNSTVTDEAEALKALTALGKSVAANQLEYIEKSEEDTEVDEAVQTYLDGLPVFSDKKEIFGDIEGYDGVKVQSVIRGKLVPALYNIFSTHKNAGAEGVKAFFNAFRNGITAALENALEDEKDDEVSEISTPKKDIKSPPKSPKKEAEDSESSSDDSSNKSAEDSKHDGEVSQEQPKKSSKGSPKGTTVVEEDSAKKKKDSQVEVEIDPTEELAALKKKHARLEKTLEKAQTNMDGYAEQIEQLTKEKELLAKEKELLGKNLTSKEAGLVASVVSTEGEDAVATLDFLTAIKTIVKGKNPFKILGALPKTKDLSEVEALMKAVNENFAKINEEYERIQKEDDEISFE
jgi:hypothetical protein